MAPGQMRSLKARVELPINALQRLDRRTVDHRVAVCSRDLDGRHDEDAIALRVPDRALNVADRVVVGNRDDAEVRSDGGVDDALRRHGRIFHIV